MNERHIVGLIYERGGKSKRQFDFPMHMQVTQELRSRIPDFRHRWTRMRAWTTMTVSAQ